MSESLGQDIFAAIQKNLPGVTAGVLTDRLIKADADEKEVEKLRMILEQANEAATKNLAHTRELERLLGLNMALDVREKAVAERERLQDLAIANERIAMQGERIKAMEGLVSSVFRNKTLIESVNRTIPVERTNNNSGGWIENHQSSETKTKDEV